jgi:hypothetical protein
MTFFSSQALSMDVGFTRHGLPFPLRVLPCPHIKLCFPSMSIYSPSPPFTRSLKVITPVLQGLSDCQDLSITSLSHHMPSELTEGTHLCSLWYTHSLSLSHLQALRNVLSPIACWETVSGSLSSASARLRATTRNSLLLASIFSVRWKAKSRAESDGEEVADGVWRIEGKV